MKPTRVGDHFVTFDDNTCWIRPGDALDEVNWQLRYGDPVKVRMIAASAVSCLTALINLPRRRRDEVIAAIRKAAAGGKGET